LKFHSTSVSISTYVITVHTVSLMIAQLQLLRLAHFPEKRKSSISFCLLQVPVDRFNYIIHSYISYVSKLVCC